jgi:hypothetical protein
MTQHHIGRNSDCAYQLSVATDDATPPRRPSSMPTQVITFWTPAAVGVTAVRSMKVFRRLPAMRRAVISAANADETR